ncbi:MAG TPA: DUF5825 family protein [Streptosporangiaceae bacterium]|jgi:hypothetical protein
MAVTPELTVAFGAGPQDDIRLVRFLRESASDLLRPRWRLAEPPAVDVSFLVHLPPPLAPPAQASGPAADYARAWRAGYGFGHCYYRLGPDFVSIVDVRDPDRAARFVLDGPAPAEAFSQLACAAFLPAAPALTVELAGQLEEAGLLVRRGDWATLLPFRLRRWPVPCTAV